MWRSFRARALWSAGLVTCLAAPAALAQPFGSDAPPAFVPRVPISALARPVSAIDPSRLRVSSSVSVGSGFAGGTHALQVTSLSYRFDAPVWMRVNVGNAWGPQGDGRSSFFLEGVNFGFRPSPGTFFEFRYQNVRSPLQYLGSPVPAEYRLP